MSINKSLTELKKQVKKSAEDLTLLNGLSNKVNSEFVMNLSQIYLFYLCEQFNTGLETAHIDIPMVGRLSVSIEQIDGVEIPEFSYKFEPYEYFSSGIVEAYNNGTIDLPDVLLDKYSKKIIAIYDDLLEE
jgi:vacuolar-type H+-ATPase subunit D/Vma8